MRITSLKLIALTCVVGLGFLVVLSVHDKITQPDSQESSPDAGQTITDLGGPTSTVLDLGEEAHFSHELISVEQTEPEIDDGFNPTDSESNTNPDITDAIPHLAENDHFRTARSEMTSLTHPPAGMNLDFRTPDSSVEQTAYETDATTNNSNAPQLFFNDAQAEELSETASEPAFDSSSNPEHSTTTAGTDFFNAPVEESPVFSETDSREQDQFFPLDSSESNNPSPVGSDDNQNPFADSQAPSANDPTSSQVNQQDSNPLLFTDEPETGTSPDGFTLENNIDTNPSSHNATSAPFKSETMPAFDSEEDSIPTTNDRKIETENAPEFEDFAEQPVLTAPATDQNPPELDSPPFFTEPEDKAPEFTKESPSHSSRQNSPPPFNQNRDAAPLEMKLPATRSDFTDLDSKQGPQQPQLKIEKIAPKNAVLGQPMIYTIRVKNIGSRPAHQVVVEDRIPKGTELTGTIPQAEMDNKRLIWKVGNFQPGDEKKILVRVIPHKEGQVGSVATVHFFSEVAAQTMIKPPELQFMVSGPAQAKIGEPVTFRFKVTNTGTKDAKEVFIRDIIPDGLTHPDGNDLEYPVGDLPAGKSEEISLTLTAARPGNISNQGVVTADGGVKIEKSATLKVLQSPLVLSRTGPKLRYVGRITEFTNLVTNDSDDSINEATVTEIIPVGMKFVEATSGGRYDSGTRTVAWSIDRLGPKQSKELKVKLIPTETGTKTSVVQAVDASGMKVGTSSQTKIEGFAALSLDVTPQEQPAAVGERLSLHIVARNRGSAVAQNLKLKITLPSEMELVTARGPSRYSQQGNQIIFDNVDQMRGQKQATYTLSLKARHSGDARVRVEINSDDLRQPLVRDESILILPENQ